MQKRAQITVFIIIGIITIAIFGFMFFITKEVSTIKLETEANRIVDSILAATPINYYVTLCLEEATKRALNISGRQGGPVYPEEYSEGLIYGTDNVSYAVVQFPTGQNQELFPEPPQYPCAGTMQHFNRDPAYCGFLNDVSVIISNFPTVSYGGFPMDFKPLCRSGCENINKTIGGAKVGDEVSISGDFSIQQSLEAFIANHTANCSLQIYNISAFQAFNVTTGNITVNTTFGFNGIEVVADFPLVIKIQDIEPVIRILKFNYFSPVRYKAVYKLAKYLAIEENIDLNFDSLAGWAGSPYTLPGFSLGRARVINPQTGANDTVIIVTDNDELHFLRNGPFVFQFAIQNRPPVLDYMEKYDSYASFIAKYDLGENMSDIATVELSSVQIRPVAKDPDGDELLFNFSGWKEDYDEIFNENLGPNCRTNPRACIERINTPLHNWSRLFNASGNVSALLPTNHTDIGPHNVTVCAYEKSNPANADCQTIRILVDDVFIVLANLTMPACYPGITNNSLISIEDPLCLDADIIDYFNPGITNYLWKIIPETARSGTIYDEYKDFVILPRDYSVFPQNDAQNFVPGLINYFASEGTKNIELGVIRGLGRSQTTGGDDITVHAKNCTPFRSETAPFPFNMIPEDSFGDTTPAEAYPLGNFSANHTCCLGDISDSSGNWQYAPSTTICYNYTQYGLWNADFLNVKQKVFDTTGKTFSPFNIITTYSSSSKPLPINSNLTNDVIKRSFLSNCGGDQGNVCDNNTRELYENVTSCRDNVSTEFARCQGAPIVAQLTKPNCIDYTATTFEEAIGTRNNNLCNVPRCTDASYAENPNANSGYGQVFNPADAHYLCNATCSGGDCKKPINCVNCRSLGWSSTSPLPEKNFTLKQTTTFNNASCSQGFLGDSCVNNPDNLQVTDYCNGIELVEFYSFDPASNPLPYSNITVSCANQSLNFLDTPAVISAGQCTNGSIAGCSDGACITNARTGTITAYCNVGNTIYYNPVAYDSNSNGIAESCRYNSISPDATHTCP